MYCNLSQIVVAFGNNRLVGFGNLLNCKSFRHRTRKCSRETFQQEFVLNSASPFPIRGNLPRCEDHPSPIGSHQPWGSKKGNMGERVPGGLRARVRRRPPIVRRPFPTGSHQPWGGVKIEYGEASPGGVTRSGSPAFPYRSPPFPNRVPSAVGK